MTEPQEQGKISSAPVFRDLVCFLFEAESGLDVEASFRPPFLVARLQPPRPFLISRGQIIKLWLMKCCSCGCTVATFDSLWYRGLSTTRLLCPWAFPGKNTGVSFHFLLQGILQDQGLNPHLLHWWILYHWATKGSPVKGRAVKKPPEARLEGSEKLLRLCIHPSLYILVNNPIHEVLL